jgi:hypothetical protein
MVGATQVDPVHEVVGKAIVGELWAASKLAA